MTEHTTYTDDLMSTPQRYAVQISAMGNYYEVYRMDTGEVVAGFRHLDDAERHAHNFNVNGHALYMVGR